MVFVPMLKTRVEEMGAAKELSYCFSEKIIPLFEIIKERYEKVYVRDEDGNYVYERKGEKNYKKVAKPTEENVITLPYINELVNDNLVFIDYFRFSIKKYGKNIDIASTELSFKLNSNLNFYMEKLLKVTEYDNMIPVISLKPDCDFPINKLEKFVEELQEQTAHIALRITEEWIDQTKDIIQRLRITDFLLFDIEEQNPETKFMEMQELSGMDAVCQMILLNSPRKTDINNGEYPEHDKTDLINNCARYIAKDNEFDGYGDYCGLKDTMPSKGGGNGKGAALALLYDYEQNTFYSYCNHDTNCGMSGYSALIPMIDADEGMLNPDGDCPGYNIIHKLPKTGSWATWHRVNVVRYIHQTYKNI